MATPIPATGRSEEIRTRIEAATPGPWKDAGDYTGIEAENGNVITRGDNSGYGCVYIDDADRDLIANAPADLNYLLDLAEDRHARVEALKSTSRRLQERLEEIRARAASTEVHLAAAQHRHRPYPDAENPNAYCLNCLTGQKEVGSNFPEYVKWPCPDAVALGMAQEVKS